MVHPRVVSGAVNVGSTSSDSDDDRLGELRRLAEHRNAWRLQRRMVVRDLAVVVDRTETLVELRTGQDDSNTCVVLVTDRRVLIGRQSDPVAPVTIERLELSDILSVQLGETVSGSLRIAASTGVVELTQFSSHDAQVLDAAIRQRLRSQQRGGATRRRERKPSTDLELLENLRRTGILTDEEFVKVRERVIQQIAVKYGRLEDPPEPDRRIGS